MCVVIQNRVHVGSDAVWHHQSQSV